MQRRIRLTETQLYGLIRQTIYEETQRQNHQERMVNRITEGIIRQLNEDKRINSFEDLADAFGEQAALNAIVEYTPWEILREDLRKRLLTITNQERQKNGIQPLSDDCDLEHVILKFRCLFKNPYRKIIKEFDRLTRGYYDYTNWVRQIYKSYVDDYRDKYGVRPIRREYLNMINRYRSLKSLEDKFSVHPDLARLIGQDEADIRYEADHMGSGDNYGDRHLKNKKKILRRYAKQLRDAAKKANS